MILLHSTNRTNLAEIGKSGLLLSKATPVEGMEDAAVWLFDRDDPSAVNRYHLSANALIEVNFALLDRDLLRPHHAVPEAFREAGSRPHAYKYYGDVGPDLLRIYGDEVWGLQPPRKLSRIMKWLGLA